MKSAMNREEAETCENQEKRSENMGECHVWLFFKVLLAKEGMKQKEWSIFGYL